MIGRCKRCAHAGATDDPQMYYCDVRCGRINMKFADSHHECFKPRTPQEGR